jgi:hypothetical protein
VKKHENGGTCEEKEQRMNKSREKREQREITFVERMSRVRI